jgi:hypothetical protein
MCGSPPSWQQILYKRLRCSHLHPDPRVLFGLSLCALAWAIGMAPERQMLEGALKVNSLRFVTQAPKGYETATPKGFLVTSLRSLTIKSGDRATLDVSLRSETLSLSGGSALSFIAGGPEPLGFKIALPPGTQIENLERDGNDELVIDLSPPITTAKSGAGVVLKIIPPIAEAVAPRNNKVALQAFLQRPDRQERLISIPREEFTLPLNNATRLRLQLANPEIPTPFETNLSVQDVEFTTEQESIFDQLPVSLSSLRSGILHLGLHKPLTLRSDQFLQIDPPGIYVLTSLRAEDGQLAVEVVGKSSRIRTGLSLEHPTTEIRGTVLSRHLSADQISGFFGFLAGVMSSLVLTLFNVD